MAEAMEGEEQLFQFVSIILQALQLAISIIMGQQQLLARDNIKARDMDEQGTAKKIGEKSKEREATGTLKFLQVLGTVLQLPQLTVSVIMGQQQQNAECARLLLLARPHPCMSPVVKLPQLADSIIIGQQQQSAECTLLLLLARILQWWSPSSRPLKMCKSLSSSSSSWLSRAECYTLTESHSSHCESVTLADERSRPNQTKPRRGHSTSQAAVG